MLLAATNAPRTLRPVDSTAIPLRHFSTREQSAGAGASALQLQLQPQPGQHSALQEGGRDRGLRAERWAEGGRPAGAGPTGICWQCRADCLDNNAEEASGNTLCAADDCALPTVTPLPTNRPREAESLGRKKESGCHPCVYPRACKIIIFISMGHDSEEKI